MISQGISKQLETRFNKWAKIRITDAELKKLIQLAMSPNAEVFKAITEDNAAFEFSKQFTEVVSDVYEYAHTSPTQLMDTTAGTLFGAYNAITGYYQNVKEYKNADAKANSIMFGTGLERTKKGFDLCIKASDFLN